MKTRKLRKISQQKPRLRLVLSSYCVPTFRRPMWTILPLFLLVAVVCGAPQGYSYSSPGHPPGRPTFGQGSGQYPHRPSNSFGSGGYDDNEYSEPANYQFQYDVSAPEYGTRFGHQESRTGDSTRGRYYVDLPDGRTQVVDYTADQTGYHPRISYN
ncbi:pro-resilin-like [Macrosteles quadrilineatus]|uniref:pro-resilin-like n=1 Tax=Macrosteles quadrilineatus TaxID=74068 RepID=UPI0023E09F81|nr:pro-resilin-like [Macrosteles quadrilineatus]